MEAMGNKTIIRFIESYFKNEAYGLQTEFFFMPPHTKGFTPHQDNTYVQADEDSFISAWVALTDVNEHNGGLIIWPEYHNEKKLESNNVKTSSNSDPQINENSKDLSAEDALNLYTQFQQFLLEDDID